MRIRLHEVTHEYWDPHALISIASLAGTPKAIDPSTMAFVFGHYARIQVKIDLLQTLPPRLLVEREGYSFKVPVSYESLPKFCNHCHIIGHLVGECRALQKIQEEMRIDKSQLDKKSKLVENVSATPHVSSSANDTSYAVQVNEDTTVAINNAIQQVFGPLHLLKIHI